ncbi:MAG: hypothetical protein EWV46_03650 [Microcystis viridis Mv_BB_P_19951000_S69D]|nr:MAG: hypothetical protein EWV46_03650 [Microcystis viridis Mv_BB_P_19951000_S69D]
MPLPIGSIALFLSVNGDMTDICEASVSHKVLHGWLLCLGLCAAGNVCQLRRNLVCIVLKKVDTFLFDNPTASLQFIC